MSDINIRQIAEELIQALERRQEEDKYRVEGIVMLHNRINMLMEEAEKAKTLATSTAEESTPSESNSSAVDKGQEVS